VLALLPTASLYVPAGQASHAPAPLPNVVPAGQPVGRAVGVKVGERLGSSVGVKLGAQMSLPVTEPLPLFENMLVVVALSGSFQQRDWENDEAPSNMDWNVVTRLTSHCERSSSNDMAP
jgi:hypothetical protein